MENFAHVAVCRINGERLGVIVTSPISQAFFASIQGQDVQVMKDGRTVVFNSLTRSQVKEILTSAFGPAFCCPICFIDTGDPCWQWRLISQNGGWPAGKTHLAKTVMAVPKTPEDARIAVLKATNKPNALSQLTSNSVQLRSALESTPATGRRLRQGVTQRQAVEAESLDALYERPATAPAPAPARVVPAAAGTHRCHACGQVIPPGFEAKKDTNKTENEIYEECDHDFDDKTKICKKCNLGQRAGRFSLLEVD